MQYAKNILVHQIIFISCLLLAFVSPEARITSVSGSETPKKTGKVETGVVSTISGIGEVDKKEYNGKTNEWGMQEAKTWVDIPKKPILNISSGYTKWDSSTKDCDKVCKIKQLEKAWTNPEIATILVNECKKQDKEVVKCIKFWASILWAESSGWNNCHKFNCYWVLWMTFNSYEESTKDWVTRFGKHWFRQKNPSNFYSDSPSWKPTTRYCTSEKSSWKPYCINWHRHAWTVFNQLTF